MLRKLWKYDFRSVARIGIPMLITILAATIIGSVNAYFTQGNLDNMEQNPDFFNTLMMFSSVIFGYFIMTIISLAATVVQIFTLIDFYKSTASDEAYLTFTLPVRSHDILRSKLLNGCLWIFIVSLVSTFGVLFINFVGSSRFLGDFSGISPEEIINTIDFNSGFVVMIVLILILIGTAFVNNQLLYYMAVFLGSIIVRKNKVLASIGCVIGVDFVYGGFITIVLSIFSAIAGGTAALSGADMLTVFNIILGVCIVLLTALNVLFYYLTIHMMDKKLNLA